MSIVDRLIETRSISRANPKDPVLAEWFGGRSNTSAGVSVTPDSALRMSAVFACVRILSSTVASLPLHIYQYMDNGGRRRAKDHSLYDLLHNLPNKWQTSYEWRQLQAVHLLLRGNAYSYIVPGRRAVDQLIPLHPDRVTPFKAPDGTVAYEYVQDNGERKVLLGQEVHHLRGISLDGITGISPIEFNRETLGMTLAAEQFGASYFGNGTVIGGVLEHPNRLGDEAYARLKKSWADRHQGPQDAHKPAILEEGMKWVPLGVPPDQAQFLETRKFQISEIARIFGVPPHMLADVDKSTSWGSGIEEQGIGFVRYVLRPWLILWEQAISRDLLSETDRRDYYAEFNVDALLRGDSAARAEYYKAGINDGWLTRNEVRIKENENPIDGLDEPLQPLNMTAVGQQVEEPDESEESLRALHQDQFGRAMDRIVSCEVKALRRALNASDDVTDFERRASLFYGHHHGFVERHLEGLSGDVGRLRRDLITDSAQAIQTACQAGIGAVRDLLDMWDTSRAWDLTDHYAEQALQGVRHGN